MRKKIIILAFLLFMILTGCNPKVDVYRFQLEDDSITMYISQTLDIECNIYLNDELTTIDYVLSSSNIEVLSVSGKTVTAESEGTATIILTLVDHPTVTSTLTVTVTPSLTMTNYQTSYVMYIGDTLEVNVTDLSDTTSAGVTIVSLQPSIASVSGSIITMNREGTATITITSNTNSESLTFTISVSERGVDSVEIDDLEATISLLDEFQLASNVSPSNANQNLIWTSSDETIATVSNTGYVQTHNTGTVTITATSVVSDSKSATITFDVTLDPMRLFEAFHVENPIRQYVTTFGYNPDQRYQWVNGSVSQYFFSDLNLIENLVPVNTNVYTGQVATPTMLTTAESLKKVRPGILKPSIDYIVYHDTGNHTPGAAAASQGSWMVSADNANNRARSWNYTVDENVVIRHIPDNEITWQGDSYDSYAKSIGVETCVDFGSDLYTTWHRTGKLMAQLLDTHGLTMDSIRQHYDFNGKNCPQTLRMAGLYSNAIDLVQAEYLVLQKLSDYTISFTSLSPEYVDERGRVIVAPETATRVAYVLTIEGDDYQASQVFYSVLKGVDGTTSVALEGELCDFNIANAFDQDVAALPRTLTVNDESKLVELRNQYNALTEIQKNLTASLPYLEAKELELHLLYAQPTQVMISQIYASDNSLTQHGYVELYNPTNQTVSFDGWVLYYAPQDTGFVTGAEAKNTLWYAFEENATIQAKSTYLIQMAAGNHENGLYLPLPDAVTSIFVEKDGRFALQNLSGPSIPPMNPPIVDFVGYGTVTQSETNPTVALTNDAALSRYHLIDSNDNQRDFKLLTPNPKNSLNELLNLSPTTEQNNAMAVDQLILALPTPLILDNEALVTAARTAYDALTATEKEFVRSLDLLLEKESEMEGLINPDLALINRAIKLTPTQIVFDFTLPTEGGVTWSYKAGQDTTYFDLVTGTYLKLSYQTNQIILIVSAGTESKEVTINFGVTPVGKQAIFTTGAVAPVAGGKTSDGMGTQAEQQTATGFGGYAMIVGDKTFFTGKNTYIPLQKPASGTTLTVNELRPLGGVAGIHNQGIRNGIPTEYSGTGALYHNVSDVALSFDPSFTYGRNNSGAYGYWKVVFSPNDDGSYTVQKGLANSGTNDTTLGQTVTLQPGEYLWCPHTFETGLNNGTYLIQPGTSSYGGVLLEGIKISLLAYKQFS